MNCTIVRVKDILACIEKELQKIVKISYSVAAESKGNRALNMAIKPCWNDSVVCMNATQIGDNIGNLA